MPLVDVIEYTGANNILVYKHPRTDFNTLSQLVVRESQTAIFYKDGKKLDVLPAGRYTLHSNNIPLLCHVVNIPFGGESPFKCEVYFVNDALSLDNRWGTKERVTVQDQEFDLLLHIGAHGNMGLHVKDPVLAMRTIVGTESQLTSEQCIEYFRCDLSMKVREFVVTAMKRPGMNFLQLESKLSAFSNEVWNSLKDRYLQVGIEIYSFNIVAFDIPEEDYAVIQEGKQMMQSLHYESERSRRQAKIDKERRIIEAQTAAEEAEIETEATTKKAVKESEADARVMDIMSDAEARKKKKEAEADAEARRIQGYTRQDEWVAKILEAYAGSGNLQNNPATMIAQAPAAFAYGQALTRGMDPLLSNLEFSNPNGNHYEKRRQKEESSTYGNDIFSEDVSPEDGFEQRTAQVNLSMEELKNRLIQSKELLDMGLISEREYQETKNALLKKLRGE